MSDEVSLHWIQVHVLKLLHEFPLTPDVEIIEAVLPKPAGGAPFETVLNFRVAAPSSAAAERGGGFAFSCAWDLPAFFQFGENQLGNFAQRFKYSLAGNGDGLVDAVL